MDINGFLENKKNQQYLMAVGLILAVASFLLYFFVFSKNGEDQGVNTRPGSAAWQASAFKDLPADVFEDEKFRRLKENKINWPNAASIKKGNDKPFAEE